MKSELNPLVKPNLDILFVGLNPSNGSSNNGHYFSVNQAFWNQLHNSGLITNSLDKNDADIKVFKGNKYNLNQWNFGITDLIPHIAESKSRKIKPTNEDCEKLKKCIKKNKPKIVIFIHKKVVSSFFRHINIKIPASNSGNLGKLMKECDTIFYNIAFPHGNSIATIEKIKLYREVKEILMNEKNNSH